MNKMKILGIVVVLIVVGVISSCSDKRDTGWEYAPNMYEHIAYDPDQMNSNFKDGKTAQVPPAGTIPVGFVKFDYPNTKDGYELAGTEVKSTLEQTPENLKEGELLFVSFCSPCHGKAGQGDGLVVQHGFPPPPSYSKRPIITRWCYERPHRRQNLSYNHLRC